MKDYDKSRKRAERHEGKRQQLGSPDPACAICGCMDIQSLTGVPFSKLPPHARALVLERHHLAGRAAGDWQVIVCLNHHAVLSDDQYDWDCRLRKPQSRDERLAAFLQGLADLFRALSHALLSLAEALQAWVRSLLGGMTGEGEA
jgi:hypothetical protein